MKELHAIARGWAGVPGRVYGYRACVPQRCTKYVARNSERGPIVADVYLSKHGAQQWHGYAGQNIVVLDFQTIRRANELESRKVDGSYEGIVINVHPSLNCDQRRQNQAGKTRVALNVQNVSNIG